MADRRKVQHSNGSQRGRDIIFGTGLYCMWVKSTQVEVESILIIIKEKLWYKLCPAFLKNVGVKSQWKSTTVVKWNAYSSSSLAYRDFRCILYKITMFLDVLYTRNRLKNACENFLHFKQPFNKLDWIFYFYFCQWKRAKLSKQASIYSEIMNQWVSWFFGIIS